MCSDIIFGYGPITQPKASQTKDLHGVLLWELLEAMLLFQRGPTGKHRRGAPAQQDLALLELQKQGGSCSHCADNSPCSDKRPQPSHSTRQELRQDLSKAGSSKAS